MARRVIRFIFVIIGAAIGYYALPFIYQAVPFQVPSLLNNVVVHFIIFGIIFYFLAALVEDYILRLIHRGEEFLKNLNLSYLIFGLVGMILGLILAWLVNLTLLGLGIPFISNVLPVIVTAILAYFGFRIGTDRREEIHSLFISRQTKNEDQDVRLVGEKVFHEYKVLDTSSIIDGRIQDVLATGFLEGNLVVTNYVLQELQHIADSSDPLKREKGRRGLDILNELQNNPRLHVEMHQESTEDNKEVDQKLVELAKELDGALVTNDYNLNKVAEFQNVPVLNINDLANSVKPVVIAGEEMSIQVVKEGTEREQGVGYLVDGTMVIVEEGKNYILETIDVVVTSTIQTSAGRMIFTKPTDEWLAKRHSETD